MIKITFPSIPPSKKNSKQVFCRGGRPTVLPSKAYTKWHKSAQGLVPFVDKPINYPLDIEYVFYIPVNKDGSTPKRTFDMSNKIESINDLLVDCKFIADDDYNIINRFCCSCEIVGYGEGRVDSFIKAQHDESLPAERTIEEILAPN